MWNPRGAGAASGQHMTRRRVDQHLLDLARRFQFVRPPCSKQVVPMTSRSRCNVGAPSRADVSATFAGAMRLVVVKATVPAAVAKDSPSLQHAALTGRSLHDIKVACVCSFAFAFIRSSPLRIRIGGVPPSGRRNGNAQATPSEFDSHHLGCRCSCFGPRWWYLQPREVALTFVAVYGGSIVALLGSLYLSGWHLVFVHVLRF